MLLGHRNASSSPAVETLETVLWPCNASGTLFFDLPEPAFGSLKRFFGSAPPPGVPHSHCWKPSSGFVALETVLLPRNASGTLFYDVPKPSLGSLKPFLGPAAPPAVPHSHCWKPSSGVAVLRPRSAFGPSEPLETVVRPRNASGTLLSDRPKLPFGYLKYFLGLAAPPAIPQSRWKPSSGLATPPILVL